MLEQLLNKSIVLPPYPICEKHSRDIHEALYQLNYRRFVLVRDNVKTILSHDDASRWLAERNMSLVPLA